MISPILGEYIATFTRAESITPVVLSYDDALDVVNHWRYLSGKKDPLPTFIGAQAEYTDGLFIYQTPEEKTEFPISEVRRFIMDTTIIPYSGKNLYVLLGVDTASLEAMNALLKILEDTPKHAIILLVVNDREALLDTIHSRTINLFHAPERIINHTYTIELESFFSGTPQPWIEMLFSMKPTREDAINILIVALRFAPSSWIDTLEQGMIELFTTNETPRNIIDRTFLCKI